MRGIIFIKQFFCDTSPIPSSPPILGKSQRQRVRQDKKNLKRTFLKKVKVRFKNAKNAQKDRTKQIVVFYFIF